MPPFSLRSERFSAAGSMSADAIRRNMGRSSLDSISLLVREAVQNSWDARIDRENGKVGISLHLSTLGRKGADTLVRTVFRHHPPDHPLPERLTPETTLLCIKDTGTAGLNGPIFHVARTGDIGRGASKQLTGGTYGFGKSTFHVASEAATLLLYTRCTQDGGVTREDRLIACSVWAPSEDERFTGRHWWGIKQAEGIAPLIGKDATELAEAIGLPKFKHSETGTVIGIIAPRFPTPFQAGGHDAAKALAEALTTWFWPRMLLRPDGDPWIDFKVFHQGQRVDIPAPMDHEPFRTLASQLVKVVSGTTADAMEICSEKPKARLGNLALDALSESAPTSPWKSMGIDGHVLGDLLDRTGGMHARCHHIALMRSTWQVVRYLPCRPVRASGHGYAGVFLVDGEAAIETAFAQSEPPAHDDWVPDSLDDDWHRRYVRIALRRIREQADDRSSAIDAQTMIGKGPDLSRLGRLLGLSLPRTDSTPRMAKPATQPTHSTSTARLAIQLIDQGSLEIIDGRKVLAVTFAVTGEIPLVGIGIIATPRVVIVGGGTEHDKDDHLDRPSVIGWRAGSGQMVKQESLRLTAGAPSEWQVLIKVPDEAQVGVSIQIAGRGQR